MTKLPLAAALLVSLLLAAPSAGQAVVTGSVTSDGEPVAFASVRMSGSPLGTAAALDGTFRLEVPAGDVSLVVSAVGFETVERSVVARDGRTIAVEVVLRATIYESGALVVTGTMQEITTGDSPVKVNLLPSRFLETVPTANVMEVIERVNGLYQQIDCGVCYTNNIRINGIEGPNTAVLIDGMPVMSSLATVYGLNGISPMLIRQIEVVKGPMSTLYGSEALGGVVNIRTKDPARTPRLSINAYTTQHREDVAELSVVALRGRTNLLLSGTLLSAVDFHDNNDDGFSDRPFQERVALFAKATRKDSNGFDRGSLVAKLYHEDRNAGLERFLDDPTGLRGSAAVYGESILTRRAELLGSWRLTPTLSLDAAGSLHDQDSFYGDAGYAASQRDGFVQWTYRPFTSGRWSRHGLLMGAALRLQQYDDGSGATGDYDASGRLLENRPDRRIVPGVFVQDDWETTERLRLLGGLRLDWQSGHGPIASPRAAIKFSPGELSTARLNVGTGFRVVNLFTEDHAAYTGGRATLILEDLRPERSVSTTASVQHILTGMGDPITIDLDVFWTRFSNKIEPDYDTPGEIRYRNLDGHAVTRGVALQIQGTAGRALRYSIGATRMNVFVESAGERSALEFAPRSQGTATVTWEAPLGFNVDYSARLTGTMTLPQFDRDTRDAYRRATGHALHAKSPRYAVHSVQVTRDSELPGGRLLQTYVALENITGYRQSSPLVGYYDGNPGFGDSFDTSYVYGPIEGRHFGLGLRLILP